MEFEFYVLNYDFNKKKVVNFNIFNNYLVHDWTLKEVKKYVRSPKNYKYVSYSNNETIYGFEGFCESLRSIIMWQEWSRVEYEISVGDAFEDDCSKLEKWDCYEQCAPNIEIIAREVIYQYRQQSKKKK